MAQITLSNLGLILPVAACRVLYVRKLSCNHNNNINANSSDLSRVAVAVVAVAVVQEVEVGFCVFTRTPPSRLIRSFSGTARRHLRRLGGAFDAGWRGHEYWRSTSEAQLISVFTKKKRCHRQYHVIIKLFINPRRFLYVH